MRFAYKVMLDTVGSDTRHTHGKFLSGRKESARFRSDQSGQLRNDFKLTILQLLILE